MPLNRYVSSALVRNITSTGPFGMFKVGGCSGCDLFAFMSPRQFLS